MRIDLLKLSTSIGEIALHQVLLPGRLELTGTRF